MNDDKTSEISTDKGIKKAKKYPPLRRLIVGKGLSKKEMVDSVMAFYEACEKEKAELNAPKR